MRRLFTGLAMLALPLGGCATSDSAPGSALSAPRHPEARLYDASRDARSDVEAALGRAAESGKQVIVVMGANWCHDSRSFAGWTETARIGGLIKEKYELVFVNVGMPQTADGHNLDIGLRFGVEVEGTPTILILSSTGELQNADTAASWRNAGSRSEDAIFEELSSFTSD